MQRRVHDGVRTDVLKEQRERADPVAPTSVMGIERGDAGRASVVTGTQAVDDAQEALVVVAEDGLGTGFAQEGPHADRIGPLREQVPDRDDAIGVRGGEQPSQLVGAAVDVANHQRPHARLPRAGYPTSMPTTSSTPVRRLIDAARVVVGRVGVDAFTLEGVAQAAGVPLGLMRYHFRTREHLLIEAWRATFRRIHEAFEARFDEGDGGLTVALEALDALWSALRDMRAFAPFLVQTLATASKDTELGDRLADFNREAEARVELGLIRLFPAHLDQLALPPDRLARAVRTGLVGLLVELAAARDDARLEAVDRTYADVRELLARVVVGPPAESRR